MLKACHTQKPKIFTLKSILIGLIGVFIVSYFTIINDDLLQQSPFILHQLPFAPLSFFILITVCWNLIWKKIMPSLMLEPPELVVILGMTLLSCGIPRIFTYFYRLLVVPVVRLASKPQWQEMGVMRFLPKIFFPLGADRNNAAYDTVFNGLIQGLSRGNEDIGFFSWPIGAYIRPLLFWGPFTILLMLCLFSMYKIMHKQWADNEQLLYPLSQITSSFIKRSGNNVIADIFMSKLFWFGMIPVLIIYGFSYLNTWFPTHVPAINLSWKLPLLNMFPVLKQAGSFRIHIGKLYFAIIGVSYFLSSEINLTMGLSNIVYVFLCTQFYLVSGSPVTPNDIANTLNGAYIGYFIIIIFMGRSYYWTVIKKAFFIDRKSGHADEAANAARIFILAFIILNVLLTLIGLDWLVSLFYTAAAMLMLIVFTRIICETGLPMLNPRWIPSSAISTIFGVGVIGPQMLMITNFISFIFFRTVEQSFLPFFATTLKMSDSLSVPSRKLLPVLSVTVVLALAITFFSSGHLFYNSGAHRNRWAFKFVTETPFNITVRSMLSLQDTGRLEPAMKKSGWAKLSLYSPNKRDTGFLLFGLICVITVSALRFRFDWWPIHPILFCIWAIWASMTTFWSFLIGWLIKLVITQILGDRIYRKLKPLFIGMLSGELLAGGIIILIGFLYYYITGTVPVGYKIFP